MSFGHPSKPSRKYSYGAREPVENLDVVNDQMFKARRYRNALVELDLKRRARVDAALCVMSPEYVVRKEARDAAERDLDAARAAIDQASAAARRSVRPLEMVEAAQAANERLKLERARFKKCSNAIFNSEPWKTGPQPEIEAWFKPEEKRLRDESGLYWGNSGHVGHSMANIRKGPPPKFHRWDGSGHLAVQIQKGMSVAGAFLRDTRVRIDPMPVEGSKRARLRTRVHFRVGSGPGKKPVFAVVPVILHRPMPADARIKWVHLIRTRIGPKYKWGVQFDLASDAWPKTDAAKDGSVGIDVGWRMRPDGSLRVAYWKDSTRGADEELMLPADWVSQMRKTRDIQSIRSGLLNDAKAALSARLKTLQKPDWLKEATRGLGIWKSQGPLAALAVKWRENRFDGDAEAYEALEAWRKRDKHLWCFEANLRNQLQARRTDIYRNFAARMRRMYATAVIEKLDLRVFHKRPKSEKPAVDGALKEHVRDACLSELFRCLKESMHVIEVPAANTTMKCPDCGHIADFDRKPVARICEGCGRLEDQDRVAARNILSAGALAAQGV